MSPLRLFTYTVLYSRFFPQVQVLALAEIFLIQKFTSPSTTEKSHVSDILYKAYMGKTVICCTLAISTVIIILYLCMVITCTCICTGVCKNSRFSAVYAHEEYIILYGRTLFQRRPFIAYSTSTQPSHSLTMVVMLRSYISMC